MHIEGSANRIMLRTNFKGKIVEASNEVLEEQGPRRYLVCKPNLGAKTPPQHTLQTARSAITTAFQTNVEGGGVSARCTGPTKASPDARKPLCFGKSLVGGMS